MIGVLVAYGSNHLLDAMDLGEAEWRLKLSVQAVLVSGAFPLVAREMGQPIAGLPLAFCAAVMVLQLAVVGFFFPETTQVALEDMERTLRST